MTAMFMEREMAARSARYLKFFEYQTRNETSHDVNGMPPLPEVIEDNSDAAWRLWRDATNASDGCEPDTQPMGLSPE